MMQLNHATPLNAIAAFDVFLTFLLSVSTDTFLSTDTAVRKSLGFNVYKLHGSE